MAQYEISDYTGFQLFHQLCLGNSHSRDEAEATLRNPFWNQVLKA